VYVSSGSEDYIFSWNPDTGENITLFAGTGSDSSLQGVPATKVWFDSPTSVLFDYSANIAYVGKLLYPINMQQVAIT
jgi:hypothetical protein